MWLQDKTLVGEESTEQFARRMFGSFDKEGLNVILVFLLDSGASYNHVVAFWTFMHFIFWSFYLLITRKDAGLCVLRSRIYNGWLSWTTYETFEPGFRARIVSLNIVNLYF